MEYDIANVKVVVHFVYASVKLSHSHMVYVAIANKM